MTDDKTNIEISIVDDDLFCSTMTSEIVKELGYSKVSTFSDGEAYLNSIQKPTKNPRIVLLDHAMDGFTGLELLERIKAIDLTVIVIIFSAQMDVHITIEYFKHGAFDYLPKGDHTVENIERSLERVTNLLKAQQNQKQSFWNKFKRFFSA